MNRIQVIRNHISPQPPCCESSPQEHHPLTQQTTSASSSVRLQQQQQPQPQPQTQDNEVILPMKIVGLGRYFPEFVVTSETVDRMCDKPIGFTERTAGVKERRWVQPAEHLATRRPLGISESFKASISPELKNSFDDSSVINVIQMAAHASREAIEEAGIQPTDLSFIIYASATQYQAIPDSSTYLQAELGLAESGIAGTSVHSTCLSFLVALNLASQMLPNFARQSGKKPYILIVSSEAASCALNFVGNPHSAGLMGDSAAAVVITLPDDHENNAECTSGIIKYNFETYGHGADLTTIRVGGSRIHPAFRTIETNDHFFNMYGRKILEFTAEKVLVFLEKMRPGLTSGNIKDFAAIIPHQASKAGMAIMCEAFQWPREILVETLAKYGNCVSVSIPSTLYEAVKVKKCIKRGDKFFMIGTGAGLNIGGIILRY